MALARNVSRNQHAGFRRLSSAAAHSHNNPFLACLALTHTDQQDRTHHVLNSDLSGNSSGTQPAYSKRRVDRTKQRNDIHMLDPTASFRIIFGPHVDELVQMLRSHYRPVLGEIFKIVHNHSKKDVEDHEGAQEVEGEEVWVREVRAAYVATGQFSFFGTENTVTVGAR